MPVTIRSLHRVLLTVLTVSPIGAASARADAIAPVVADMTALKPVAAAEAAVEPPVIAEEYEPERSTWRLEDGLDWTALRDPRQTEPATSRLSLPQGADVASTSIWSHSENGNGSTAVKVRRVLSKMWDGVVGADFSLAAPATPSSGPIDPARLLPGAAPETSTGTAWVSATAPALPFGWDKASIEARIDPARDLGKLGISVAKSVPLSNQFALSLEGGASAQEPLTGLVSPTAPAVSPSYRFDHTVRLSIAPTGTSVAIGATQSALDDRSLHRLSADQKVFGSVDISGSLNETATGFYDQSLSAKFKRTW